MAQQVQKIAGKIREEGRELSNTGRICQLPDNIQSHTLVIAKLLELLIARAIFKIHKIANENRT